MLSEEVIYSEIEISELIDTHLNNLIFVIENLDIYDKYFIKYIENDSTWLLIEKGNGQIYFSEINKSYTQEMNDYCINNVLVNKDFFTKAKTTWGPFGVPINEFVEEVEKACTMLAKAIGGINKQFLNSYVMSQILSFLTQKS